MAEVIANGIKIHYERTGGKKPPVVLCHGLTDSGHCWPRVVAALQADYDVITPDARAHGLSDAPPSGYTYEDLAADVAGLIDALGLHKPAVIGHSMGGMAAALLGAAYPTLASRLVLEDPPFRTTATSPEGRVAQAKGWESLIARMKKGTMEQIMANQPPVGPRMTEWDESELAPWYEAKQQVNPLIVAITGNTPAVWQDFIGKIACPTLLLWSEATRGAIVTEEVAELAATLNPRIRTVHIANAGHNIRRENFAQYIEAVKAFLSDTGI